MVFWLIEFKPCESYNSLELDFGRSSWIICDRGSKQLKFRVNIRHAEQRESSLRQVIGNKRQHVLMIEMCMMVSYLKQCRCSNSLYLARWPVCCRFAVPVDHYSLGMCRWYPVCCRFAVPVDNHDVVLCHSHPVCFRVAVPFDHRDVVLCCSRPVCCRFAVPVGHHNVGLCCRGPFFAHQLDDPSSSESLNRLLTSLSVSANRSTTTTRS